MQDQLLHILCRIGLRDAQLGGDGLIGIRLSIEKAGFLCMQLLFVKSVQRVGRIFYNGGEGDISKPESTQGLLVEMIYISIVPFTI